MENKRKNWDEYFMDIAQMAAARSTCPRLSVGAVLTRDNKIISTGYNGSPSGAVHCANVGCLIDNHHCKRVIHAEVNAIIHSAGSNKYTVLYVTHNPCLDCYKVAHQAGVRRIVYGELYKPVDYAALGINNNYMPDMVLLKTGSTGNLHDNY